MNELDLLKKHWNKDHQYPKVSSETFSKIIHKSSSSSVKWIFIISMIEFFLGFILMLYMTFFSKSNHEMMANLPYFEIFSWVSSAIFYVIIITFIIRFYRLYSQIRITDNTKNLMNSIIQTRKVVKNYILFNISIFFVFFIIGGIVGVFFTPREGFDQVTGFIKTTIIFVLVFMATFGAFLFWLVYKLIYGWLLRKLDRNFKELQMKEKE